VLAGAAVLLLALGVVIGLRFADRERRACLARWAYVNAALACNGGPAVTKRGYDAFREELVSVLRTRAASGAPTEVAVYFRDLAAGPIFGIDEFTQFVPASLLKLPLVLAYLALEENAPGFIDQTVVYHSDGGVPEQSILPATTLRDGQSYAIATLLANTLRFSDNASYLLLLRHLRTRQNSDAILLQTYRDLGIVNPNDALDETVNVRGYASLFRLLYNASYLSPELSERALAWLAESRFDEALVAGVPKGVVVAHKFGERDLGTARQLHDCGIVYYPKNPYLLCVMTRGDDLRELAETVRFVSGMVYREVDSRSPAVRAFGRIKR
jgi:beta-lactamase class A